MDKSSNGLSLFQFQQRFATDNQCLAYLSAESRENGFTCSKCGHTHYCQSAFQRMNRFTTTLSECTLNDIISSVDYLPKQHNQPFWTITKIINDKWRWNTEITKVKKLWTFLGRHINFPHHQAFWRWNFDF